MAYYKRIAVVEDDASFAEFLKMILEEEGFEVKVFLNPQIALEDISSFRPTLVIVDLRMPKMDGLEFMEKVKAILPSTSFIIVTAYGNIPTAVSAIKKGATDFVTKPLPSVNEFINKVKNVMKKTEFFVEISDLPPAEILFAGMEDVYSMIMDVAKTDLTILLEGETGTGKSLIAKAIHKMSGRKGNFIDVLMSAIPDTLIESELFGYEKGAFTGAVKSKPGKLELADGGTIFLDEIGELNPVVQAKLLKVLQNKSFERLGGTKEIKIDARFILASNRDIRKLVSEGRFREDLYYRISVFSIRIPPLRERREHILKIADYIAKRASTLLGKEFRPFSEKSKEIMLNYHWPGNVRELENTIERAVVLSKGDYIEIEVDYEDKEHTEVKLTDLKELEKIAIVRALRKTGGNRKKASELLGISLRTLYNKLKQYGIS